MKSITALAAVAVTGFPPKVEMVRPVTESATSGRATVRPMGLPLPRPLAPVMMSGVTPHCSIPNHLPPVRPHPVCTSSLMKMPPWLRTIFSTIWKYSFGGVMNPPTLLLDPEPLAAGTAPSGLHFIANEDAPVVAHDLFDNLEILFRRRDESAHALDRFSNEAGHASAGAGADQLLHILRAPDFAIGVGQAEGTPVTVGVVGVNDSGLRRPQAPRALAGERHGHGGAAVVGMA